MASAAFSDRSGPGGVVHNPASPYSREMAKWEMGYSPFGPPGRPREQQGHQPYPAMFYKMKRSTTNGEFIVEHYQEAEDDAQASNLLSRGFHQGRPAAIAAVEAEEQALAVGAAERAKSDRRMSDAAQAEAARADAATLDHVAVVPETPIRRRQAREQTGE